MQLSELITIIAIITGPIAVFILEKLWRKAEWKRRRKEEVVFDLVGSRAGTKTPLNAARLERALNSIPVVFSDNDEIAQAYNNFYEIKVKGRDPQLATDKLITLILTVCREMGYGDIEESTIKNIVNLHVQKFS